MAHDSPIQFKGTTLKIILAQLQNADVAELHAALAELTGNSPDFFENELAVLDFPQPGSLPASIDWPGLRALLRQSGLQAVATRGLPDELATAAALAGLPSVQADALGRPRSKEVDVAAPAAPAQPVESRPAPEPAPAVAAPAAAAAPVPDALARTVILDKPLRSGQRFYARGGDLVVMAMVSAGAEVIADGNIHIYAPLRGRALAGAAGDKTARIFTTCMEAELISIAGLYRTFAAGVPAELARLPATASLAQDGEQSRLNIAPLSIS